MIDLHVHTTASDGEYMPSKIVKMAKENNVTTVAITDHDTIEGIEEAIEAGTKLGIEIIPGIELNAKVPKGKMHIVGYFFDINNKEFLKKMAELKKDREDRNQQFIEEFNKKGIAITLEQVKKYVIGNVVGKPHFARALYDNGYIKDIEEAYSNYFNVEPFNEIKRKGITPREAIQIIKNAGGIAVIAHPVTLKLDDEELKNKIQELKEYGLDGIECYNNIHTKEDIKKLKEIAQENNLLITAGSDFHGPITTPNVKIGRGKDDNIISDIPDMLEKIKKYAKKDR